MTELNSKLTPTLEQRIVAARGNGSMAPGDLEVLLAEVEAEAVDADAIARQERERAVDDILVAPAGAAERVVTAELRRDRLRASIAPLQQKLAEALAAEYHEKWLTKYRRIAERRNTAVEQYARYSELAAELVRILQLAEEVDREIGEVNGSAPDGEHHRLAQVSVSHITNNLLLPAEQPSGRNIWPLRTSGDFAAEFAQSMRFDRHPGAAWCDPVYLQQRDAALAADRQRDEAYHKAAARAEEERQNRQEREAFLQQRRA